MPNSHAAEIVTDLCIIGAGPAGISVARTLAGTGARICILESGGPNIERRVQRLSRGETDGYPLHLLHRSRVRAFGGTLRHPRVLHGGWLARPLDPIDFESRPGRPDFGWPFDRDHLLPYYVQAQRDCGLAPYDLVDGDPLSDGRPAPPVQDDEIVPTLFQVCSADFRDELQAFARTANVRVELHTRVADITTDPSGRRVASVTAVRADRSRVVVRPRVVVLATGGIENARLLLTADGGKGIGNEHDLVGRYFAERLSLPVGQVVLSGSHTVDDAGFFPSLHDATGAVRIAESVQRDKDLLNCTFSLVPRPAAVSTPAVRSLTTLRKAVGRRPRIDGFGTHVRNVVTGLPDVAELALGKVMARPRTLMLRAMGEQAPNSLSRVSLGSRRDDLGIPVARVTWRRSTDDVESLRSSVDILAAAFRADGFGYVETLFDDVPATLVEGNHHHMGTTRMNVDPRKGVLDADSRVHSVENLYVAGASVFPTYGASNPTFTIIALALRLADHLRGVLGSGG